LTEGAVPAWRAAATPPPLREGPHLWRAGLDRCRIDENLLEDGERVRARRFAFAEDRRRFLAEHGLRRRLLAAYLGTTPAALRVEPDAMGKPRLLGGALSFSGSESGGTALLAVARTGELGVDIERIRPERADLRFARRYFHPAETAALEALDGEARLRAFFATWTRKEALVKAVGQGLRIPLASFRVGVLADEPAGPLAYEADWPTSRDWRLLALPLGDEAAGGLALGAAVPDPLLLDWAGD
jgi:4'-phosphopantetheinyl transferase